MKEIELIAEQIEAEIAEQEYINEQEIWTLFDTFPQPIKVESELPF